METETIYGQLARLFEYPGEDYVARARSCAERMRREQSDEIPEAAVLLEAFSTAIQDLGADELQELFTRTFDLNPVCSLEIGWHLYGEEYQRGEFLVKMRQQLRARDLPESGELPDHLTHALALLDRMEPEEASEFASHCLLPALDKMRAGWQKNHNAYWPLLESLFALLKSRYTYQPLQHLVRVPELRVIE